MGALCAACAALLLLPVTAHGGIRAAFEYPWYPAKWTVNGAHVSGDDSPDPADGIHPLLGFYDSSNQAVVDRHIAWSDYAGIQVQISSWWGEGKNREGSRIPLRLNRTRALGSPLKWTVYYEKEVGANPSTAEIRSDLAYLGAYASHPSWLRIKGKPVIFVHAGNEAACQVASRWKQAAPGWYVQMKLGSGFATCANQPDAWHQYGPTSRTQRHAGYYTAISPGFWRADETSPGLVRDLSAWRAAIRTMVANNDPWQLVTTFNDFGEGTAVEPAREWMEKPSCAQVQLADCPGMYLRALRTNGVTPPPPPSGDPVIAFAGDIAPAGGPGSSSATAALLSDATNVLVGGDNQYESGTCSEYSVSYDLSWGAYKAITYPSVGNHDPLSSCFASYFGRTVSWYSFDVGAWHLVALDSNQPSNSQQLAWLDNDLATHSNRCTLAFWHHPRFNSGSTHGNNTGVGTFWTRLYNANADVVLNSHEHVFERFSPQTPAGAGDPARGIREFIVGTGGRSHHSFGTAKPNSEVRNPSTFGVLKVTLHSTSYDWKFQPVSGGTFTDAGSGSCH